MERCEVTEFGLWSNAPSVFLEFMKQRKMNIKRKVTRFV